MKRTSLKRKAGRVSFKDQEDIINLEECDPSVGRFQNLVATEIVSPQKVFSLRTITFNHVRKLSMISHGLDKKMKELVHTSATNILIESDRWPEWPLISIFWCSTAILLVLFTENETKSHFALIHPSDIPPVHRIPQFYRPPLQWPSHVILLLIQQHRLAKQRARSRPQHQQPHHHHAIGRRIRTAQEVRQGSVARPSKERLFTSASVVKPKNHNKVWPLLFLNIKLHKARDAEWATGLERAPPVYV